MRFAPLSLAALALVAFAPAARAQVFVTPTSYDMPNGNSGSFNYWDESYNGSGNTSLDGAPLSGGVGDLTDGIIAAANWNVVEAPVGPGPFVGWSTEPTITFNFGSVFNFQEIRVHFDDSNGAGGVSAALGVVVNGTTFP